MVVRGVREFLVKQVINHYVSKRLGLQIDDSIEITRILQDVVAVDENYYDEFDDAEFRKFVAQGGLDKMKLEEDELEKIKVEFFYENC